MSTKWYVHVNKHVIAANKKNGTNEPAVRFQRGKSGKSVYCFAAEFGSGRVVYKPTGEPLLKCGARLVIEVDQEPKVIA